MSKPKILIIEDERGLVEPLTYNLEREGFEVIASFDGQDGLRQAQVRLPDLIVLDLMLPLKPGLEVCRALRAGSQTRDIPIVMLTAKAEESDQLIGFAVGADDYVTKPYSMKVLIERIKKELRRRREREATPQGEVIECRGVVVDRHRHRALFDDKELALTPTEFRLLEVMLRQPGRAFTRHELMDAAIGEDAIVLERTIDVHVKSLRKKLGEKSRTLSRRCGEWATGSARKWSRTHDPRPDRARRRGAGGSALTGAVGAERWVNSPRMTRIWRGASMPSRTCPPSSRTTVTQISSPM